MLDGQVVLCAGHGCTGLHAQGTLLYEGRETFLHSVLQLRHWHQGEVFAVAHGGWYVGRERAERLEELTE